MSGTRTFRLLLAVIIAFPVLRAVPAYSWHGSGNITALAIDPQRPTTLYAGTSDRGVFKTTDGGATWGATGLANVHVAALAIDPQTPSIIYASTEGGGVLKSSDGGQSWLAINTINTGFTGAADLVIDPQTPTILYSFIPNTIPNPNAGLFKSTDGGANWSATSLMACDDAPAPDPLYSSSVGPLAIDSRTPTTLYAAVYCQTPEGQDWGEVRKSTDGGANWLTTGLDFNWWVWTGVWFQSIYVLAIDPQTPTAHLYAAGYDYLGGHNSLLRSTDGGTSWSTLITDQTSAFFPLAIAPRTDPEAPATLYRGSHDRGVLKSTDGGVTWSAVNAGLTETLQAYGFGLSLRDLVIDPLNPATLYLGTVVGVFKSTDGGAYWSPTGLFQHSPLSSLSLNPSRVVGGTASTGTVNLMTAAPVGGITVTLASSNPAIATVPANVTVSAGAMSANFMVSTSPVTGYTSVTISTSFDDAARSAGLTVDPAVTLSSVSLNPGSVTAGSTSTGTVTLSAAAPAGGAVVSLYSGNPFSATVPSSVTVPAGVTSASFTVSTNSATISTWVDIWGYYNVYRNALLTLTPATTLSSASLNPGSVTAGSTSTGTVTLSTVAPTGGAVVTVSSSNTSVATVPASVTVPAGAASASFTVSTAPCTSGSVTISGAYGGVTRSAELTVALPVADAITIQLADYFTGKHELRVAAKSTSSTTTLWVYATSSGELIGMLRNLGDGKYSGQFTWSVNPQNITVRSSLCGSATSVVRSK